MIKSKISKQKGFTLIELLVVIAIIGLLAAIVLVNTKSTNMKARDVKRIADLRQISTAMALCYDDADCNGTERFISIEAGANTVTQIDKDGNPFFIKVPRDPLNRDTYQYTWIANESPYQYYCVYARLENIANTYFCSSNKASAQKTYSSGSPTKDDCCGHDID